MRCCVDLSRARRIGAGLLMLLVLGACGQRGPLVLPGTSSAPVEQPDTASDDDEDEDEDGSER